MLNRSVRSFVFLLRCKEERTQCGKFYCSSVTCLIKEMSLLVIKRTRAFSFEYVNSNLITSHGDIESLIISHHTLHCWQNFVELNCIAELFNELRLCIEIIMHWNCIIPSRIGGVMHRSPIEFAELWKVLVELFVLFIKCIMLITFQSICE